MQGNMPSFINGITFERLGLGTVPFSILGVRHNPSLNSDHLGIGEPRCRHWIKSIVW